MPLARNEQPGLIKPYMQLSVFSVKSVLKASYLKRGQFIPLLLFSFFFFSSSSLSLSLSLSLSRFFYKRYPPPRERLMSDVTNKLTEED